MTDYLRPSEAAETEAQPSGVDWPAVMLAAHLRNELRMAAETSDRSRQAQIGASEIGSACDRQIAYRAHHVPAVRFPDPWAAMLGTGAHSVLADSMRRRDAGVGRYLVEHPVTYRGIPGTVDLFDRWDHTLTDWKTTRRTVRALRTAGPTRRQIVQVHLYGAGLRAAGEDCDAVALAFLRVGGDSTLEDLWVWRTPLDISIADRAIDRYLALVETDPVSAEPHPSRLCGWCDHYRKGSADLSVACPGEDTA